MPVRDVCLFLLLDFFVKPFILNDFFSLSFSVAFPLRHVITNKANIQKTPVNNPAALACCNYKYSLYVAVLNSIWNFTESYVLAFHQCISLWMQYYIVNRQFTGNRKRALVTLLSQCVLTTQGAVVTNHISNTTNLSPV